MESLIKNSFVLQSIIDHLHYLIAATDLELRVTACNRSFRNAFRDTFGKEVKVGDCLLEFSGTPDYNRFVAFWTRTVQGERFSFLEENTSTFIHEVEYSPMYDPLGKIVGAIHIGKPINESWDRREVEQVQLDESEKELYWPHIMEFGRSKNAESIDRQLSWQLHTGQTPEKYTKYGWLNAHHPSYRPRIARIWKKVTSCKRPSAFSIMTMVFNASLNEYRYTLINSTPHFDQSGEVSYWSCAGVDMHDLMNTQRSLAQTTKRLNMILEVANMGTWEWDAGTDQLTTDKKVSELFGLEKPAHTWKELKLVLVDYSVVERALKESVERNIPYDCEFEIKWPDGSRKWIGARGEYIKSENKFVGVNWDITLRKQMEQEGLRYMKHEEEMRVSKQAEEFERKRAEEAEENQRQQEDFIDTVCHEIRNPLVGISGGTVLAQEELVAMQKSLQELQMYKVDISCEKIKDHLDSILKCAEQQKVIVDDVLDLSKLQNNKIDLTPVPFKLSSTVNMVIQMFHSKAVEKNLYIKTQLPETEQFLKADVHRLQQVFINLVSNAVKFTHTGGIVLSASLDGTLDLPRLCVCLEDTGIGISPEDQQHLFGRFAQARNTSTTYGGSGLGLAISKRIVEAMGGRISVESQKGVGSKFSFFVHVEKATDSEISILESTPDEPPDEQSLECTNCKVLVVDDNLLNQKILATYLEKSGFSFQLANDGLEAIQVVQQHTTDLIFMDIEMPNMNGLQATRAIRQSEKEHTIPRVAIIGLSGNARKEKIEAAFDAGMDHFLTKPYHKAEILKAICKYAPRRDRKHSLSLMENISPKRAKIE